MQIKTTHIFLKNPELNERLARRALAEHRSKTAVVVRALDRYFASESASESGSDKDR